MNTHIIRSWETILCPNSEAIPTGRHSHTCITHKQSLLVFGGLPCDIRNEKENSTKELYEYNCLVNSWTKSHNEHDIPSVPRSGHSIVYNDNQFLVFGGVTSRCCTYLNDVLIYNFDTNQYTTVSGDHGPPPRAHHMAVVYNNSMFCFGGLGYNSRNRLAYKKDMFEFQIDSQKWTQVITTGHVPSARASATFVVFGEYAILMGGIRPRAYLSDIHVFRFKDRSWSSLPLQGKPLRPRCGHIAVVHGSTMLVFGGKTQYGACNSFEAIDFITNSWHPVEYEGAPPSARYGHTGIVLNSSLFVFGGLGVTDDAYLNDLHKFDLKSFELSMTPALALQPKEQEVDLSKLSLSISDDELDMNEANEIFIINSLVPYHDAIQISKNSIPQYIHLQQVIERSQGTYPHDINSTMPVVFTGGQIKSLTPAEYAAFLYYDLIALYLLGQSNVYRQTGTSLCRDMSVLPNHFRVLGESGRIDKQVSLQFHTALRISDGDLARFNDALVLQELKEQHISNFAVRSDIDTDDIENPRTLIDREKNPVNAKIGVLCCIVDDRDNLRYEVAEFTPIQVAVLHGYVGIVDALLGRKDISVDCKRSEMYDIALTRLTLYRERNIQEFMVNGNMIRGTRSMPPLWWTEDS